MGQVETKKLKANGVMQKLEKNSKNIICMDLLHQNPKTLKKYLINSKN